jgi:hypothetical protein
MPVRPHSPYNLLVSQNQPKPTPTGDRRQAMEIEIAGLFLRTAAQLFVAATGLLATLCALAALTAERPSKRQMHR